jgi:A1 cistron-splicing factor AAR2
MDKSFVLCSFLRCNCQGKPNLLLGELQLSFVSFLIGHSLESFEHWKSLIEIFCFSDDAIHFRLETLHVYREGLEGGADSSSLNQSRSEWSRELFSDLFAQFLRVFAAQLLEVPKDFFVDVISRENFLCSCLEALFSSLKSGDGVGGTTGGHFITPLVARNGEILQQIVQSRFGWEFHDEQSRLNQRLSNDCPDDDEDGPVIVDMNAEVF